MILITGSYENLITRADTLSNFNQKTRSQTIVYFHIFLSIDEDGSVLATAQRPSSDNSSILCVMRRTAALAAEKAPWKLSRYESVSRSPAILSRISPRSDRPAARDSRYDRAAVRLMSTFAASGQYSSSSHLCSFSLNHSDSWPRARNGSDLSYGT